MSNHLTDISLIASNRTAVFLNEYHVRCNIDCYYYSSYHNCGDKTLTALPTCIYCVVLGIIGYVAGQ